MPKLHELLAVESNLSGQSDKCRADLLETFTKKRHLFEEKLQTYVPDQEGAPPTVESQSELNTTVPKELEWLQGHLVKSIDTAFHIAKANQKAVADIVLENGTVLAKAVPVTSLLELEKRMKEVHEIAVGIPTLDPAKGFKEDADKGKYVYRARDTERERTKKVNKVLILVPPTEKHPAQAEKIVEDERIGVLKTQEWSGLITPAKKAEIIDRIEQVARAIKKARARANDTEADVTDKIGSALLGYALAG